MQETWVWSLDREDPPEKEMINPLQYAYLENPMTEEPVVAKWVGHDLVTKQQQQLNFT